MPARDEVLARIRAANKAGGTANAAGQPQATREPPGDLDRPRLLGLLAERLADYGSGVRRCSPAQLPATIAAAISERGARRIVVPPGLDLSSAGPDGHSLPGVPRWVVDDGLAAGELDHFDAVITGATVAIAQTGTIVLDGSAGQGRRALTLVPDYHLCILRDSQVVAHITQALPLLRARCPLTWISGPSATSDIELDRVEGVHGPRTLEVILVSEHS
ncbi:MAG TPA: lactate utilization protein C [Streptosporangiaceae bacterium]|nr:lactate utilization protein C [Streptosporangiaceae bacterium]